MKLLYIVYSELGSLIFQSWNYNLKSLIYSKSSTHCRWQGFLIDLTTYLNLINCQKPWGQQNLGLTILKLMFLLFSILSKEYGMYIFLRSLTLSVPIYRNFQLNGAKFEVSNLEEKKLHNRILYKIFFLLQSLRLCI